MGVPCGHRRAEVLMGVPCGHRRAGRTGAGRGAHMIVQPGLGGRPALRQCSLGDARVLRRRQMLAAQLGQTAPPTLSFNACAKGVSGRRGREPAPARPSGRIRVAPAHIGPRTSLRARRPLTPTRSRLSSETGRFAAARCLRHAWPRGQVDSPQLGVCVTPGLGDRSIRRRSVLASYCPRGHVGSPQPGAHIACPRRHVDRKIMTRALSFPRRTYRSAAARYDATPVLGDILNRSGPTPTCRLRMDMTRRRSPHRPRHLSAGTYRLLRAGVGPALGFADGIVLWRKHPRSGGGGEVWPSCAASICRRRSARASPERALSEAGPPPRHLAPRSCAGAWPAPPRPVPNGPRSHELARNPTARPRDRPQSVLRYSITARRSSSLR